MKVIGFGGCCTFRNSIDTIKEAFTLIQMPDEAPKESEDHLRTADSPFDGCGQIIQSGFGWLAAAILFLVIRTLIEIIFGSK